MLKFASKSDINVSLKCTVRLLEDTEILECEFQLHQKGCHLLETVCKQLNLVEKDYFGLRYVDHSRQRHWLDLSKTVLKQVKDMEPILLSFRVKFYPPDPFRLREEITRYQIYLQLKRDLLHGRLYCPPVEAAVLAACVVQAELGDYDPTEHGEEYISELKLLLKQTPEIEAKVAEHHRTTMQGMTPEQAETSFLKQAYQLDTYGVDPHPVKDTRGTQMYLGINHRGIVTFQGSRKTNHFRWPEVHKINYEGRMFIIHLIYNEDPRTKKKYSVGFKCPTGAACRHVWRCAIEQMLFFTLPSSSDAPSVVTGGSLFSWGTKFRYSGRVEREILEDDSPARHEPEPCVNRTASFRRKAASVPATPSTPQGSELGYGSLPRANHSAPASDTRLDATGGVIDGGGLDLQRALETVAEDHEICGRHRAATLQEEFLRAERGEFPQSATSDNIPGDIQDSGFGESMLLMDSGDTTAPTTSTSSNNTEHTYQVIGNNNRNGMLSAKDATGGVDGGPAAFDDYYFRDSFEHSSSESHLVDASKHHVTGGLTHRTTAIGRHTGPAKSASVSGALASGCPNPLGHPVAGTIINPNSVSHGTPVTTAINSPSPLPPRRFSLLRVFVPTFLLVVCTLVLATIIILETESQVLGPIRQSPEMVTLRREYYEPVKAYLRDRILGPNWIKTSTTATTQSTPATSSPSSSPTTTSSTNNA